MRNMWWTMVLREGKWVKVYVCGYGLSVAALAEFNRETTGELLSEVELDRTLDLLNAGTASKSEQSAIVFEIEHRIELIRILREQRDILIAAIGDLANPNISCLPETASSNRGDPVAPG